MEARTAKKATDFMMVEGFGSDLLANMKPLKGEHSQLIYFERLELVNPTTCLLWRQTSRFYRLIVRSFKGKFGGGLELTCRAIQNGNDLRRKCL